MPPFGRPKETNCQQNAPPAQSSRKLKIMCIAVFIWKSHPLYPFLLLLNRDEYHNRPTTPLGWWDGGEILGERDEQAGGTWLACSRDGKLVFLTDVREIRIHCSKVEVIYLFATWKGKKSPKEFAEELAGETDIYVGFNLIVADLCSKSMVYITNRPNDCRLSIAEVSPGIHILSNAKLDTPRPKAQRLLCSFEDAEIKCGDSEISIEEISEKLMNNTTKDEESKLPHIYPPEFEYHISAIFIEVDTPLRRYGTRSTSAVVLITRGEVCFYKKYLDEDGWKKFTISYHIEK